jgi:hypothetical protein
MPHDAAVYYPPDHLYVKTPAETAAAVNAAVASQRAKYASNAAAVDTEFRWISGTAPVISTFTPATAVANVAMPALQVTLTGTGFKTGDVVVWGGVDKTATLLSATQLQISVTTPAAAVSVNAYVRSLSGLVSNTKLFSFTATARSAEGASSKKKGK